MKLSLLEVHKKIQKTDTEKSAKMSTNNIVSFLSRIQTVSGKILCSDPNSAWTKRAMRKVDEAKMKFRKQDPVHAEGASSERSRGRADPKTATELPLNSQWNRVTTRQKSIWKSQRQSQMGLI